MTVFLGILVLALATICLFLLWLLSCLNRDYNELEQIAELQLQILEHLAADREENK